MLSEPETWTQQGYQLNRFLKANPEPRFLQNAHKQLNLINSHFDACMPTSVFVLLLIIAIYAPLALPQVSPKAIHAIVTDAKPHTEEEEAGDNKSTDTWV